MRLALLWRMRVVPTMPAGLLGTASCCATSTRPTCRHRAKVGTAIERAATGDRRPHRRSCVTVRPPGYLSRVGGTPPLPSEPSLAVDPEETGRVEPADE
jgi:hypothetical protein